MTGVTTCGCGADGRKPDVDLAFAAGALALRLQKIADAATHGDRTASAALIGALRKLDEFLDEAGEA